MFVAVCAIVEAWCFAFVNIEVECIGFYVCYCNRHITFNGISFNFYAHKNHMIPEIVFISVADT